MKRLALLLSLLGLSAHAQLRVDVSRDLWISAYSKEVEGNNGGSHKLKLKGIQEFFLIDFDPTSFKGKRVVKAQLHLHLSSPDAPLRRTTVSSISQDWVEGTGSSYSKVDGASSFVWAKTGQTRWGNDDPDITSVVCGEGGSIWGFADATSPDTEGWQIVPISPEVVQARLEDRSHGFYVIDDVGNEYSRDGNTFKYTNFVNRYVSSREDKKAHRPYFTLWLEDGAVATPKLTEKANPVTPATLPAIPQLKSVKPTLPCKDIFGTELSSTHFYAAKGESIGFSVSGKAQVDAPTLRVKLYSMPKVGGFHDPLVPADFDAGVGDGEETFIDLYIPKDTPAGDLEGKITVNGTTMPFTVTVWNFTLPDRLSFLPQMNAYGLPGHARDYYRLAHEHRVVLNQLPYGWTGKVDEPAPKLGGDGRWDWTKFDAEFGPLLDGSAFSDLPRGAVPVDAYYLLLNENWPMKHDEHFKGGYWVENAFDDAYWTQFRDMAAEIAKHFEAKGWTEPMFEFYLNNKVYFKKDDWRKCTAAWIFDEPVHTQDFWAIRHYGREFWKATSPYQNVHLTYRADISRPQWQRELLDHCVNVEVVSGVLRQYWPRIQRRAKDCGNLYYMYGGANAIGTPNVANAAWCIEAWALGADGVVPWNTIGKPEAWQTPDELSVLYPTANGPVPSIRLKTFRAGQQLVEYLTQYCATTGDSRDSVMAALRATPGLSATLVKKNEEDAGKSKFGTDTQPAFESLRIRLGAYLNARAPASKDRWYDPRPKRPDLSKAIEVAPLPH
ncbi:MAG: DUF4091 domain-containing protein [Verrucomicrobiaceae bacterium]|nr:DUF4091 domain-containing protein [Verrucomicrobiaceae bacterium]